MENVAFLGMVATTSVCKISIVKSLSGIKVSIVLPWVQKPQGFRHVERPVYDSPDLHLGLLFGRGLAQPEHRGLANHHAPPPNIRQVALNNRIFDASMLHIDRTLGHPMCSGPLVLMALPLAARGRCNRLP